MAVLFYTSSLPGNEIHLPPFPNSDKVVHFAAYTVLGAAIAWRKALRRRVAGIGASSPTAQSPVSLQDFPAPRRDFLGLAVGMIYGFSDEVHQLFVPLRMYDYSDMAADFLGVAAGLLIYGRIQRKVFLKGPPKNPAKGLAEPSL